ncbi:MAG: DUF1573 domain-containing protein [Candidatus Zixiibacteriota bacterium]
MRLTIGLVLILVGLAVPTVAADSGFRVDNTEFDFGLLPPNATVVHRVWLQGGERDTARVTEIKTGCGCLTSTAAETIILPGDSMGVVLYWQTRGSLGPQEVSAYLYVELSPFPVEVPLKGNVVTPSSPNASLVWTPTVLVLARNQEASTRQVVQMVNKRGSELKVSLIETGPGISVVLPETIDPGTPATGYVSRSSDGPPPPFESSFTMELAGNQEAPFRVTIPVVCGDFSFRPVFTTTENSAK